MLLVAAFILLATPPGYRLQLMLGTTWRVTTANVVLLSLPSLAAVMQAMKSLAPTHLVLAGAGAGLLAGCAGPACVFPLFFRESCRPGASGMYGDCHIRRSRWCICSGYLAVVTLPEGCTDNRAAQNQFPA